MKRNDLNKLSFRDCLYCDGFNYKCKLYFETNDERCIWDKYVNNQLEFIVKEVLRRDAKNRT